MRAIYGIAITILIHPKTFQDRQWTVNSRAAGPPLGWRWCRHEIENYLVDPAVVSEAMGWSMHGGRGSSSSSLRKRVRYYEAARWTVGIVRRSCCLRITS